MENKYFKDKILLQDPIKVRIEGYFKQSCEIKRINNTKIIGIQHCYVCKVLDTDEYIYLTFKISEPRFYKFKKSEYVFRIYKVNTLYFNYYLDNSYFDHELIIHKTTFQFRNNINSKFNTIISYGIFSCPFFDYMPYNDTFRFLKHKEECFIRQYYTKSIQTK